jgi:hypothetical protein
MTGDLMKEFFAAVFQFFVLGEVFGTASLGFVERTESALNFVELLVEVLTLGARHGSSPRRNGIRRELSVLSSQFSVSINTEYRVARNKFPLSGQ